ncbi:MAG: TSUP family transporter [Hyphomicrobiaceae bacterium]|nr:TSUP family transporter [Hyphomicrobiaceae bacterium]
MPAALVLGLVSTMVATAFLSGIFGMAGGLILMGVLLALLPLPEAMALHAVAQMASNGWRGVLWARHAHWRAAANFLAGCALAFLAWSLWQYVPSKPLAFILLGLSPFAIRLVPGTLKPDPQRLGHGILFGSASMALMLLAGVSGPLIDAFFLSGRLDRRQIVATKAVCQLASHGAKLSYFGGLVGQAGSLDPLLAAAAVAASIAGTSLARPVLDRLSDAQFRLWAARIIAAIATVYLAQGAYLLLRP